MDLQTQYMTLIAMSLSGAILGAVYDMYRVVLKHWRFLRVLGPLFDLAFWFFAAILVFWALLWANQGDFRLVIFLLLCLGLLIYRLLFRRWVIGGTVGVILGIKAVLLFFYRLFEWLVIRPLEILLRLLAALFSVVARLFRVCERLLLWPFRHLFIRFASLIQQRLASGQKGGLNKWLKGWAKIKGFAAALSKWFFNPKD